MEHKLADDRQEDISAEDAWVGSLFRQPLQGFAVADDEEHVGREESLSCGLQVSHLHSLHDTLASNVFPFASLAVMKPLLSFYLASLHLRLQLLARMLLQWPRAGTFEKTSD